MKKYIHPNEWCPVHELRNYEGIHGESAEFTDKEIVAIIRMQKEFNYWQAEISKRAGFLSPDPYYIVED